MKHDTSCTETTEIDVIGHVKYETKHGSIVFRVYYVCQLQCQSQGGGIKKYISFIAATFTHLFNLQQFCPFPDTLYQSVTR